MVDRIVGYGPGRGIIEAGMSRDETIQELVRRLAEFYQPERIYLFGSAARGEEGPDSDVDLCVVLPDDAPESLYRDRSIHRRFGGWERQWM
jgi:predicted nucleotidyltransferase